MVVKDKLLRVQGRRSRGGCLICKQRHIKCDEALPACAKCVGSNRTCQYADRTVASIPRFVLYTCPEDPHLSLQTSLRDRRALWHFHHRTLDQIEGPFKSELWSCIIPSLAQHDAVVRQSLLALSSFHEHYLNTDSTNLSALKIAETYHQNAQRQIINMKTPDRQFDSILCACIIFAACEGLRGNFATATKHAHAGMKMIAAQIQNDQRQDQVFRDSNENLFHIFLDLQAQVMEANDDNFEMECPLLEEQIGSIPDQFDEPSDALSHLQILTTRLLELYEKAGEYHETNTWIPSQIAPALQPTYEALRRDHDKWARAISFRSSQVTKHYDRRRHAGRLLVEIFAASLETELHVFLHGEASYDTLKEVNLPILDLIETYLELRRDAIPADTFAKRDSGPSSFSSSPEVIPALFELAIRTRLPQLHARAVGILRSSRWREGVWDSTSAANLAGQIVELKRKGAIEAARNHTGCKFLITDIIPLSEQKVLINFGFKKIQPGTFDSFWLETIDPEQGQVQSCILDIVTS